MPRRGSARPHFETTPWPNLPEDGLAFAPPCPVEELLALFCALYVAEGEGDEGAGQPFQGGRQRLASTAVLARSPTTSRSLSRQTSKRKSSTRSRPKLELLNCRAIMDATFGSLANKFDLGLGCAQHVRDDVEKTSTTTVPIGNHSISDVSSSFGVAASFHGRRVEPSGIAFRSL